MQKIAAAVANLPGGLRYGEWLNREKSGRQQCDAEISAADRVHAPARGLIRFLRAASVAR